MCMALPGKVLEIVGPDRVTGRVAVLGRERLVNMMLLEDVRVGEWVLIELGLAVQRISEDEALSWAQMLEEMSTSGGAGVGS